MMNDVVIVAAKRTPIGAFLGAFSEIPATQLGASLIEKMLSENNIPLKEVDQVIMGQVLTAGCGQNPARQTAIKAGLPKETTALTINKVCGSGMASVLLATQIIKNGDAELIIAGGQENMSMSPYLLHNTRIGNRLGNQVIVDSLVNDGLTDAYHYYHMGITAENIAKKYSISRQEQDVFSLSSQEKALKAIEQDKFKNEIIPIEVTCKKENKLITKDESPRQTSIEKLSTLNPVFLKENGTVTAGNSSSINDGAAAVIVCSSKKAKELELIPLVSIASYANTGIAPEIMGMGPVSAINKCLERINKSVGDIDLFECNEAFAAQSLAVQKELSVPSEKLNIHGGAIALGHPIGASGCRILVSLINELKLNNLNMGVAALCIGGGEGIAIAVENIK